MTTAADLDRERIAAVNRAERQRFAAAHPRSRELFERARGSLVGGVPMTWMAKWVGGHPVYAAGAHGASVTDVDGHTYVDLALGDTGAMAGHSPPATVAAVQRRLHEHGGATLMLPTEDAAVVGEELGRRFGVPLWSFALTATDANRWALRLCRAMTARPYVLVFSHCYHGSVDETFVTLDAGARPRSREGNVGPAVDPTVTTRVCEFNDLDALQGTKPNDEVDVLFIDDQPGDLQLPSSVELEVTETEPGLRGDTASGGGQKPATLETGAQVTVPLFVNIGDSIKVDTRSGSYMSRA